MTKFTVIRDGLFFGNGPAAGCTEFIEIEAVDLSAACEAARLLGEEDLGCETEVHAVYVVPTEALVSVAFDATKAVRDREAERQAKNAARRKAYAAKKAAADASVEDDMDRWSDQNRCAR